MSMRIISGSARGTHIEAPEGLDTRPVTDKIRQSLFLISGNSIFLDAAFWIFFPVLEVWDLKRCRETQMK